MAGVKSYIKDAMPRSWDIVLRKNRCFQSFVDQFYKAIAKEKNKNKYYYNITIMNARHYLRCYSIHTIAVGFNFKEGVDFWRNIQEQITNYEFNCN